MMTWMNLWYLLPLSSRWMTWNLFLALIPLVLSFWLFQTAKQCLVLWWMGLFLFVAFLPNAPYVLTDLIHLVFDIQSTDSLLFNTLVIIPKYVLFIGIGFEAYVLSLINLGDYLKRQGLAHWVLQGELLLHGLSAIGVYLGRIERFNSWDLMTRPHRVVRSVADTFLDPQPLFFMILGFAVIAGLYWIIKQINLALLLRHQYIKAVKE
ncbi:DUF1361 domain-containing protein [Leptodesmis sp.]|uniref:DUF1361 domain-containing protein n=1 Tax=Leptodesmis sp. TaxID=3100501 RepID=UPI0040534888